MPIDSTLSIDDRAFIPNVLKENLFIARGYLVGQSNGLHWIVVDPRRHPMYVWEKKRTDAYVSTATGLGAVAFTNGPMMEHRSMAKRIAVGAVAGAVVVGGVALKLAWGGPKVWLIGAVAALGGAVIGGAIAAFSVGRGVPFREVRGKHHDIYDEGAGNTTALCWLRRAGGTDFATYDVTFGDDTRKWKDVDAEVIDGLICLIKGFAPMSASQSAPNYNEPFKNLSTARAAVWALIPLNTPAPPVPDPSGIPAELLVRPLGPGDLAGVTLFVPGYSTPMNGVLLAAAGPRSTTSVQQILIKIGARDAVGMDGNESMMIGSGGDAFQASATLREPLLDFGFYCK